MKLFLSNLFIIITGLILLFSTTLLLDLPFIQAHTVRQILIYVLMLIIAFVIVRLVLLINNQSKMDV